MIKCMLGHQWEGCICLKCGETHDVDDSEHLWEQQNECIYKCARCGLEKEKHYWKDNCECERCGKIGKLYHKWELTDGECLPKCAVCGIIDEIELHARHVWEPLSPGMLQCSKCKTEKTCNCSSMEYIGNCQARCSSCGAIAESHEREVITAGRGDGAIIMGYHPCKRCGKK